MNSYLDKIVEYKRLELEAARRLIPIKDVRSMAEDSAPAIGFQKRFLASEAPSRIIAEVKKASPSAGVIRADFKPVEIAHDYEDHGASALSVLTDEHFFQGHLDYLKAIRQAVKLPLLRKDFTLDAYHLYEARASGADAILLIVAILSLPQLKDYSDLAHELGMSALIEVHDAEEMVLATKIQAPLIGVNNRNLKTFEVSLATSESLIPSKPKNSLMISESGLKTGGDLKRLNACGYDGFLIGESFMKQPSPGLALSRLVEEACA